MIVGIIILTTTRKKNTHKTQLSSVPLAYIRFMFATASRSQWLDIGLVLFFNKRTSNTILCQCLLQKIKRSTQPQHIGEYWTNGYCIQNSEYLPNNKLIEKKKIRSNKNKTKNNKNGTRAYIVVFKKYLSAEELCVFWMVKHTRKSFEHRTPSKLLRLLVNVKRRSSLFDPIDSDTASDRTIAGHHFCCRLDILSSPHIIDACTVAHMVTVACVMTRHLHS